MKKKGIEFKDDNEAATSATADYIHSRFPALSEEMSKLYAKLIGFEENDQKISEILERITVNKYPDLTDDEVRVWIETEKYHEKATLNEAKALKLSAPSKPEMSEELKIIREKAIEKFAQGLREYFNKLRLDNDQ